MDDLENKTQKIVSLQNEKLREHGITFKILANSVQYYTPGKRLSETILHNADLPNNFIDDHDIDEVMNILDAINTVAIEIAIEKNLK